MGPGMFDGMWSALLLVLVLVGVGLVVGGFVLGAWLW